MPPLYLLLCVIALTFAGVGMDSYRRGQTHSALRALAKERRMHFSRHDQLRLTARVAAHLPIPGAAFVRVIDLIYGTDGDQHRYIFTAEYTAGVVKSKKRIRRAATFTEPRERSDLVQMCDIQLAPLDLPLIEQYRALLPPNPQPLLSPTPQTRSHFHPGRPT
jgi:hypothetical protein